MLVGKFPPKAEMAECASGDCLLPMEIVRIEKALDGRRQHEGSPINGRPSLYTPLQLRTVTPKTLKTVSATLQINHIAVIDALKERTVCLEVAPVYIDGTPTCKCLAKACVTINSIERNSSCPVAQ